jgi:hypothetical protein
MQSDPILVVTRPKYGVLTHWGVRFPDGTVYEYLPGINLRKTDDDGFADGHDVTIVAKIPAHQAHLVYERLRQLERNPRAYDPLTWNCEDFARWLVSGEAGSAQVMVALALAGLVALLTITAR